MKKMMHESEMTIDRLAEIVTYLKENPRVIFDRYPQYDRKIYELLGSLGEDQNYSVNYQITEQKPIDAMGLKDLQTMFTFILRGERFCDGCIAEYIDNGTLLELAERASELLQSRQTV